MTTVVVRVLDVAVGIRVEPDERAGAWAAEVAQAWSRCLADPSTPHEHHVSVHVPANDDHEALRSAMRRLTTQVTLEALKAHAGSRILLHAGAVTDPASGATAVCVAASGTGKTTLTRELSRDWGYLTDEAVAVEDDLTLLPYPKPLSLVTGEGPKHEVSPDALQLGLAHAHPVITHLAVLERDHGATATATCEELTLIDALLALAPQTSGLARDPRGLDRLAALVTRVGPVVRYRYPEATDVVDPIRSRTLRGPTARVSEPFSTTSSRFGGSVATDRTGVAPAVEPGHVELAPDVSLLHSGGRHLLLDGVSLSEVSPLAAQVLTLASDPVTPTTLLDAVVDEFGHPADGEAEQALDELLATLTAKGWVVRG